MTVFLFLPPTVLDELQAYCDPFSAVQKVDYCRHHACLSVGVARSSVACVLPSVFLSCHTEVIALCVQEVQYIDT